MVQEIVLIHNYKTQDISGNTRTQEPKIYCPRITHILIFPKKFWARKCALYMAKYSVWEVRNAEINLLMDAKLVSILQSKKM